MYCRSSWWWPHVFFLLILQHMGVNSEESSTTNETYWGNITTGSDLVNVSKEEISRIPNTTLETYPSNITTRPEPVHITSEQTTGTSNNTLEKYWGNLRKGPDLINITRIETSGTPDTTLDTFWGNSSTGPDLIYITNKEISRTSDTTLETYTSNVTAGPDLSYIREETSGTTNTALGSYSSTVSSGSHLSYIIGETVATSNSSEELFQSNVTTDPGVVYLGEDTTLEMDRTPSPGAVFCIQDSDCPPFTMCTGQEGLRTCQCHLGSYFHHDVGCVTVRTFPVRISVSVLYWEELLLNRSEHDIIGRVIGHMTTAQYHQAVLRLGLLFQNVLDHVPGYLSTSVTDVQLGEGHMTIVHSFSTLYPVTEEEVWTALTASPLFCAEPRASCTSPLTSDDYQGLSLCDFDMCDSSSSDCRSHGGLVTCECRRGYYKYSPADRACRACGSGFQRTENRCERCPIGFGGFNCEESYLLVVIVESCVGCVLLVSLITLLVFYLRRKERQKPTFMDSIVLGVPTDQPALRLPRAQFSCRREWEWNKPPGKVLTDIHQEAANPDGPAIHMKTFGESARVSAPNSYHGHHNLSFISD